MAIYDSYLVTNLHRHTLCAHVFDRIACNFNSIRWCVSTDWNSHFYFYTWSNDIWHLNFLMCMFSNVHGTSVGFEIKTILKQKNMIWCTHEIISTIFRTQMDCMANFYTKCLPAIFQIDAKFLNFQTIDQHIDFIFNVKLLVFILDFTYYNPDKIIKCTKQNWFSKQF